MGLRMEMEKENPSILLKTIKSELDYCTTRLQIEKEKMVEGIDKLCLIFEKINEHIDDCVKQGAEG